jgi:integrase
VALCKTLATRHPEGPLFRTATGRPWCHVCYVAEKLRRTCRQLGLAGVTLYGYRHTFATDALANGVPDAQVAELLGHSGTATLYRHYAHLTARAKTLRDALGRVR